MPDDEPRATVPLIVEDSVVGVVVADFPPGHLPDDATRRLVETIAGQAAQPLERARLHEREHAARVQAEVSARRTRRLQRLTASSLGLRHYPRPRDIHFTPGNIHLWSSTLNGGYVRKDIFNVCFGFLES